jgi:hypothetical protein
MANAFNPNFIGNATSVVTLPASGGSAINPLASSVFTITPTATQTLTASAGNAGDEVTLFVYTSGVTSYTLTFGTGFKSTGTLATGTTTAKQFSIQFISDGTNLCEVGRTTAQ